MKQYIRIYSVGVWNSTFKMMLSLAFAIRIYSVGVWNAKDDKTADTSDKN